jgi:SAM-dependent methyltransferase
MEAVYHESDAFVYACAATHLTHYCQEVDRRVADAVEKQFPDRRNLRILAFGDGIGTDSLRFAAIGHDVTYFEFEGFSSALALRRFCRMNLQDRTRILHSPEEIPLEEFDVVICREVLEHVVNPPSLIENLRGYLRDSGIATITESFDRVEASLPTHLAENRKYAGETERLFVTTGFRFLYSYADKRPMVFEKALASDRSRFSSLRRDRTGVIQGAIRQVGRRLLRLVPF